MVDDVATNDERWQTHRWTTITDYYLTATLWLTLRY